MIRTILKHPAVSVLTKCEPVTVFDDRLKELCQDLVDTLADNKRPAVGLAANQIGVCKRVFVVWDQRTSVPPMFYINPVVHKTRGEQLGIEGCLSLTPQDDCVISRPKIISWTAQDIDGKFIRGKLAGFDARVFLHELDHLNGITILERKAMQK